MEENHKVNHVDALINRARSGDRDAASVLLEQYRPAITSYLAQRTRSREDALELAQETLVRAFGSIASYRGEGTFSSWLQSIAANLLRNYYERTLPKRSKLTSLEELTENSSAAVQRGDDEVCPYRIADSQAYVNKLLSHLPKACTAIESDVVLSVYQDCDYETISLMLNIEQDAARQHFLRGRGKLLAHLAEHDPEMLGGRDAILAAWTVACQSQDPQMRPSQDELSAWANPRGKAKAFRKAMIKLARFLSH